MKKIIAILTVLIMAASLFATDGGTITVKASAPKTAPVFTIKGGTESGTYGTAASGTIEVAESSFDVGDSSSNVTLYFQILQTNKAKFSKQTATITVEATALKCTIESTDYTTAAPTVATGIALSSAASTAGITAGTATGTAPAQTIALTYPNGTINGATTPVEVLTTAYKWVGKDELPVGTYTATVTLTYTAV